jgi:hypothetical protein
MEIGFCGIIKKMSLHNNDISKYVKTLISLSYKDSPIPLHLITAYTLQSSGCEFWEIRYKVDETYGSGLKPDYLIKLKTFTVDSTKFSDNMMLFTELLKMDLFHGKKIRKIKGTLQDFVAKKVYRATFKREPSKFFVNFPRLEIDTFLESKPYPERDYIKAKVFDIFKIQL